jgi:hypothetical protein
MYKKRIQTELPGVVSAAVGNRTGGSYETTTPVTAKFREDIRAAVQLTRDELLAALTNAVAAVLPSCC